MGYYTHITGQLEITPAIDLKKVEHLSGEKDGYFTFTIVPGDQDVRIVNGVVTVVGTKPDMIMVENYFEDSIKAYDFDNQVERLVDLAKDNGAVVDGVFYGDGEESEDFWALVVEANAIHTERGEVVYSHQTKTAQAQAWQQAHDAICLLNISGCHINPFGSP